MKDKQQSQKTKRQKRFLLILPVLTLPFATMAFWVLGGGQGKVNARSLAQKGLNINLPSANLKDDQDLNKLSYYEKATRDSVKLQELMNSDPYYDQAQSFLRDQPLAASLNQDTIPFAGSFQNDFDSHNTDPNEAKVYRKLERLNSALRQSGTSRNSGSYTEAPEINNVSASNTGLDHMKQITNGVDEGNAEDPEMQQLNVMLEKVLDIQHPERVKEKIRQASADHRGQVFPVTGGGQRRTTTILESENISSSGHDNTDQMKDGFYSFGSSSDDIQEQNGISAIVPVSQTLVNGSTVKLKLTSDIFINGDFIPKGTFIYGTAALNGERLKVKIETIRYGESIYPVSLSVFDADGVAGIHIPDAISRNVAKESAQRTIQDIGLSTYDPSLKVQAAGAGIEAVKSLLSKKVKLIKVSVTAGYKVLLVDEKQKQF